MSTNYSFLDVAVLDAVRQRFAAGDALVVLSPDLTRALWANGPGAALFGHGDIETLVGAEAVLSPVARRQLAATSGFPEIGSDRAVTVRLSAGMSGQATGLLASAITMPDRQKAILLAAPAALAGADAASEIAMRAVSGFTEEGEFLAFVDGHGNVEAASEGFAALDIPRETLAAMAGEAAGGGDRTVKRPIVVGGRSYPAGLARLADDPARHLLVVIDDGQVEEAVADTPEPVTAERKTGPGQQSGTPDQTPAASNISGEASPVTDTEDAASADAPGRQPDMELNRAPVRFVWRTGPDGAFNTISPEFAAVVGQQASDIIGRRFSDVAAEFGLDPAGEITQLLERRDTWSGRTVLWPAAGLRVPVDLAALPVYDRDRVFQGFRGFGVARPADSVAGDTNADPVPEAEPTPPAVETTDEASSDAGQAADEARMRAPADPFRGEVPALTIVPKPDRRFTDKVIRLAEHRPTADDKNLSSVERSAFREIGERLKKDGVPSGDKPGTGEAGEAKPKADVGAAPEASAKPERPDVIAAAGQAAASAEDAAPAGIVAPTHAPAAPLGPATEPGRLASGDAGIEPPPETGADTALEDDSERLATLAEAEDAAELARLDGAPDGGGAEEQQPVPARSLLDYAKRADDGGAAEARQQDEQPVTGRDAANPDDSMAAADFADARDDETLPADNAAGEQERAQTPAPASDRDEDAIPQAGGSRADDDRPSERPRLSVPPLRSAGVMPSAFATASDGVPDTTILAKLPVPLLIHSGDALYYANDEFLDLTGYDTLEALTEAGGLDVVFADPYANDTAGDQSDRSLRMRTSQGSEFPVEAVLRAVPWRGGKALMLVLRRSADGAASPRDGAADRDPAGDMVQPDIADLKARVAEMRTIIDTATDGVVLIGRDGMIRSISRPAEALFGFDGDDVAGKPFASLFAIESQRSASEYLASLSEPGVASLMNDGREVIGREAQGRFIPLFMTVGRLPGDNGYCAVVRDITQWKRAEEDLTQARTVAERASSQKTDFLARISHEIRTPLNAIIGFSELMVDEKFGPVANDRYRDYLRDINRSGNHVLDLVNDLLDISKIEAGQQEMDYEAVSLNDALAETVALMQPQANRERVIIRSSLASRLPEVVADLRSIRQIALNILSNAIRYTQAGGQVIVSTAYEPSGNVVLRVRDTGVGMTQAEIEQALKPFKQINALKRGRGDGTGLGLPLTKAMVEANRAQFTIHSTPGEGTLVEIAFPSTRVLAE